MKTDSPILIIGGNGKTGARVNARLLALGHSTRPVSRSTNISFYWENPETWQAAIHGTSAAYITYQPDLAFEKAKATIAEFGKLAKENGLERVVLLSGRGEKGAELAEEALQACGVPWSIVRASWFCQNFSESFMLEGILTGELFLPADDTVEPFVDADDIADVVVATLTEQGHHGKLYEVTGPQALSFEQAVKTISDALNRPIKYTEISIDLFIDTLQSEGAPADMQWLMKELFTVVFDGRNSQVCDGVQRAIGREPTDFSEYARRTAATGEWKAADKKIGESSSASGS
jgi:uncharacterized protein YbjT (DUF2867 family)